MHPTMGKTEETKKGISVAVWIFFGLLILKISGLTDMSWWFVTLPLWAGLAVYLCFVILFLVMLFISMIQSWRI